MPQHSNWPDATDTSNLPRLPSPRESALYTYDMLVSLKRMADAHKQEKLATLVQAAASEAKALTSRE